MERREAIRIKLSPHWIPGTVDNKPVRVEYSLPITIQTDNFHYQIINPLLEADLLLLQTKN
jgi:hypothetical protein